VGCNAFAMLSRSPQTEAGQGFAGDNTQLERSVFL
jgi:hypothetical protein